LVELVMTITIMAIVMVPVLGAVISTIRASASNTSFADVQTILQNAADRVNRAPTATCDYSPFVNAAVQTEGWDVSRAVVVQQHWVPGPTAAAPGAWTLKACENDVYTELLVQLVTITITSPDGSISKTMEVVKSDV
jgi:hypothetical protein